MYTAKSIVLEKMCNIQVDNMAASTSKRLKGSRHQSQSSLIIVHVAAQFTNTYCQFTARFYFINESFKEFENVFTLVWILHVEGTVDLDQAIEAFDD